MIADPESHLPNNRFNDGKCDPAGRFWGQNEFTFTASGTLATLELQNLPPAATTIDHVSVTPLAAAGFPPGAGD